MSTTLAIDSSNFHPIQALAPGTTQTITTSGSSAATSSAFAAGTTVVRIVATKDCHITFAASPTATTSLPFMPANQVEYFKVTAGEKCAAIQSSEAGTVFVTEMS
ncbi:hypothetical protein [Acinetobacter sp. UBA6526]|uniref:hypothetical protein n=1 Tax=Acinetobacter sp. UBA6526 TaxID=1945950 RepID=UPI0025811C64|nr:hypothetical protein [Acinetobacter sp. UBA6526]